MNFENVNIRNMLALITKTKVMKFNLDEKNPKDLIDIKAYEIEKEKNRKEAVELLNKIFEEI